MHTNTHLTFASLRAKHPLSDFAGIKSSKNTGIYRTNKSDELSRPCSIRDGQGIEEQPRVVKLIGNQSQNIEDILAGLACHCGCRTEFKKILTLLMDKIYKLREERNHLREQLHSTKRKERGGVGVGVNTEQDMQHNMRDELLKLIDDSKLRSEPNELPPVDIVAVSTDELQDLMRVKGESSITFQHEANETNLLQQSCLSGISKISKRSKLSFEKEQHFQQRVLQQCKSNTENKLGSLKTYCNQRSLDLDTIENYIEKLNCAKQLNRHQTDKRRNAIF